MNGDEQQSVKSAGGGSQAAPVTAREPVEPFAFPGGAAPRIPCGDLFMCEPDRPRHPREADPESKTPATDDQIAEQVRRSFETGRAQGIEEGRAQERTALSAARHAAEQERATQVAEALSRLAAERDRFFEQAETQVARLALSIAARILRREAEADPLLLTGAVRAALGQLSEAAEARLRVPAPDLELWRETIAHLPNLALRPAVVADEAMRAGDCILETSMGTGDLSLASQLGEVERSFFSVKSPRSLPAVAPANDPSRPAEVLA